MPTKLRKWGNSLGIPIPKPIAQKHGLKAGDTVDLHIQDGTVLVIPAKRRRRSKYKLSDILRGYKGPNPHRYVFNDPPVGRELL